MAVYSILQDHSPANILLSKYSSLQRQGMPCLNRKGLPCLNRKCIPSPNRKGLICLIVCTSPIMTPNRKAKACLGCVQ